MKKQLLLLSPVLITFVILFSSFGGFDNSDYPSGSPGGYTGSPGDGKNCTQCHGGSASTVTGWITSNIPVEGYVPGTTYTITATATGTGKKGFEVSPQSSSGALLGTLTPGSGNKLCNGGKAITQSSGVTSGTATWNFTWTAPVAGTGSVTFYGAFTVSEPVTKLSTMTVNEAVTVPLTATATATPQIICAGQTSQLGVDVSGGTPPYTYSWTSNPPGFTSGIQNPTVTPETTTTYAVQVTDGSSSVNSSVLVTVIQPPQSFAGDDTTYCHDIAEIQLQGTASNYSALSWTTSGDGTFNTTTSLNCIYYPGATDRTSGGVNLYLTASPSVPCSNPAASGFHVILDPCSGVPQNEISFTYSISPNPTTGIINIGLTNTESQIDLVLYDSQGKMVFSQILKKVHSPLSIDLSFLTKGVYFLNAKSDSKIKTMKIILL